MKEISLVRRGFVCNIWWIGALFDEDVKVQQLEREKKKTWKFSRKTIKEMWSRTRKISIQRRWQWFTLKIEADDGTPSLCNFNEKVKKGTRCDEKSCWTKLFLLDLLYSYNVKGAHKFVTGKEKRTWWCSCLLEFLFSKQRVEVSFLRQRKP